MAVQKRTREQIVIALHGYIQLNDLWWLLPMHQTGLKHWELLDKDGSKNFKVFKFAAIDWEFELIGEGLIQLLIADNNPKTVTYDSFIKLLSVRITNGSFYDVPPTNKSSFLNLNQITERLLLLTEEHIGISNLYFLSKNHRTGEFQRFCWTHFKDAYQFKVDAIEIVNKYEIFQLGNIIFISEINGDMLLNWDVSTEMQCALSSIKNLVLNVCVL